LNEINNKHLDFIYYLYISLDQTNHCFFFLCAHVKNQFPHKDLHTCYYNNSEENYDVLENVVMAYD